MFRRAQTAGSAPIFAVLVAGTIIIVASLSSLFYHWGVLQKVVHAIAWGMRRAMGTSGSETLSAAGNIFMGQTEAPLLIKPYVARMTRRDVPVLRQEHDHGQDEGDADEE